MLVKKGKTNWDFILIVFVIAVFVCTLFYYIFTRTDIVPGDLFIKETRVVADYNRDNIPYGDNVQYVDDLPLVKIVDKKLVEDQIMATKEFLYRTMNKEHKGFYKYYYPETDTFEERLYGPYTASVIYTFIYIYNLYPDRELLGYIKDGAEFLLFLQNMDELDDNYGAIHYSYYHQEDRLQKRFVSGTTALSIFTFLRLYELLGDNVYMKRARLAGDWLVKMQREDGVILPYTEYSEDKGEWVSGNKESLLYNGQTLSGLSKLYGATGDDKYRLAAEKIANNFARKYEKAKGYVTGEYRAVNPISNSWVVMSTMDFYKVNPDKRYFNVIFPLADEVLKNQNLNENDLIYYGSWGGSYSSSGQGWMSEVMTEVYKFCLTEKGENCEKYKDAVVRVIRWLMQSTYTDLNTPTKTALGGTFWSRANRYVRTDSSCHAGNSFALILEYLDDDILLSIDK